MGSSKRFLVVSPYGIVSEDQIRESRKLLRGKSEVYFQSPQGNFKDNEFTPFTFSQENYIDCKKHFTEIYSGNETKLTFSEVFEPIDLKSYKKIDLDWYYKIQDWASYSSFIASEHNKLCERPKYMVTHKWYGFVKNT